ncbi:MAG: AI-2E family transporter, partial [Bacillota bacterium]|nr:AI-2E family transporter [Bacillota bacterium]
MIDVSNTLLIKLAKLLLLVALVAGLGYFISMGFNIFIRTLIPWLTPFIFALIIALLIDPIVAYGQKKFGISRTIATFIGVVIFMIGISLFIFLVIFNVVVDIIDFSANLPEYYKIIRQVAEDAIAQAQYLQYLYLVDLPPVMLDNITANIDNISTSLRDFSRRIIDYTVYMLSTLPGLLTLAIVALVATFFFSRDKEEVAKAMLEIMPVGFRPRLMLVSSRLVSALIGFIRAQFILISITALQTIIGLYIIGVEYALTVGILVGIVDILPIIG